MKTGLFQSCGLCWVFQICWHIECSTFTVSASRIWNISAGIPSPPLALFVVMPPKAHLTSHSMMSDSRWVITPSWLSGLWRSFLYSSSVYCFHLYLYGILLIIKQKGLMPSAITWMQIEINMLSEVRQRRNIAWHPLYVESKEKWYKWTYKREKDSQTSRMSLWWPGRWIGRRDS